MSTGLRHDILLKDIPISRALSPWHLPTTTLLGRSVTHSTTSSHKKFSLDKWRRSSALKLGKMKDGIKTTRLLVAPVGCIEVQRAMRLHRRCLCYYAVSPVVTIDLHTVGSVRLLFRLGAIVRPRVQKSILVDYRRWFHGHARNRGVGLFGLR